jgi:hypothetical protein
MAAINSTDVTVSFVAPASGTVYVDLDCLVEQLTNGATTFFGLLTHGTTTQVGDYAEVTLLETEPEQIRGRCTVEYSGLTASDTYQVDFGAYCSTAGDSRELMGVGIGPIVMTVWGS